MGHSVEGRFPFLDHRVIEFSSGPPLRLKMCGLDEKHLLKRAVAGLVPQAVIERPKQPYRAPDSISFLSQTAGRSGSDYVAEMLGRRGVVECGVFDPGAVGKLTEKSERVGLRGMRDNMAFVAILSTQLLSSQLLQSS